MNILIVTMVIASIAFLLRFLGALVHEERSARCLPQVHLLNNSFNTKGGRVQYYARVNLCLVEPEKLQVEHARSTSGAKVAQVQKWG